MKILKETNWCDFFLSLGLYAMLIIFLFMTDFSLKTYLLLAIPWFLVYKSLTYLCNLAYTTKKELAAVKDALAKKDLKINEKVDSVDC